MRLVMKTEKFAVYDDVLEQEDFRNMWFYVQGEKYCQPHVAEWTKVWRLNDGAPMGSQDYRFTQRPFNNPLDILSDVIEKVAPDHSELLGNWNEIHMRSYLYPRNTKLSWHNDYGYTGACIFYTHQNIVEKYKPPFSALALANQQ